MVTRFLVDETDSSPQDFESFSLRPLRYVSIFLLTFSMPLCNPFMPLCNPFTPAHAAKSYTQLTQAFNYDSLSHFNYFCNPFMHLYLSFFRLSHHPRISRALLLSFAFCTLRIENTKALGLIRELFASHRIINAHLSVRYNSVGV